MKVHARRHFSGFPSISDTEIESVQGPTGTPPLLHHRSYSKIAQHKQGLKERRET